MLTRKIQRPWPETDRNAAFRRHRNFGRYGLSTGLRRAGPERQHRGLCGPSVVQRGNSSLKLRNSYRGHQLKTPLPFRRVENAHQGTL